LSKRENEYESGKRDKPLGEEEAGEVEKAEKLAMVVAALDLMAVEAEAEEEEEDLETGCWGV
jgi:hypothetical protein